MWVSMPRTPMVGQVDDHVLGGIQRRGCRPDGDGFAGAHLAADHPDRALVHAPGDAGDRLTVTGVAVQHGWCQITPERHPGEIPNVIAAVEYSYRHLTLTLDIDLGEVVDG
jgi:hypothetical protein